MRETLGEGRIGHNITGKGPGDHSVVPLRREDEYLWRQPGTRSIDELMANEEVIEHESRGGLRVFGYLAIVATFYAFLFAAWLVYKHHAM